MSCEIHVSKLLQPSLLTKDELVTILQERCVKIDNMGAMSKDQLVDIFSRVITPLQQRSSRRSLTSNCDIPINNHYRDSSDGTIAKKIKLDMHNGDLNKSILKRKNSDVKPSNDVPSPKKSRQRIHWP